MGAIELLMAALFGAGVTLALKGFGQPRQKITIYPLSHVAFEPSLADLDRLRLLDEARAAVLDGRLSQANKLKNDGPADQPSKPGADLEN